MRSLLQQRFTQRIMERSRAAVILEARQEIEREQSRDIVTQEKEDVYVPFYFHVDTTPRRPRERQPSEEDLYMTMK